MLFVDDEIADQRSGEEAGKGENVGDGVDVFMRGERKDAGFESLEGRLLYRWVGAVKD